MRRVLYAVLTAALALSGCAKFDEINTNPDSTTKSNAAMLCTHCILSTSKFGGDAKAYISENAFPKYVGYANEGQMGTQYNVIGAATFGGILMLPNIDLMNEYAAGTAQAPSYEAVGKYLRARLFYGMTMQMGDVPYSEAGQGKTHGNFTPAYDSQEDVFLGVLDELREADDLFAQGAPFDGDPTIYAGDPDKWRRATNAFALRILMELSKRVDDSKIDIKARFAEIVNEGYLMDETTGFWGLLYSSQQKYPLYSTSDAFTSRTLPSSLLIDHLKRLNDRRLFYYAEPAAAKINAGGSPSDPDSYVGVDVAMEYSEMNAGHSAGQFSKINLRYQLEEQAEPRILLTYAEQQFILAEARIRGWITTGTAKEYYESGVRSAMLSLAEYAVKGYEHGMTIDEAYVDEYLRGAAAFAATEEEQLKQIWLQRYILNFMQDSQTSYYEYRRTGYPEFPINPETNLNPDMPDRMPMRWRYPDSEAGQNRENLEAALARQYDGYDSVDKIMWILK